MQKASFSIQDALSNLQIKALNEMQLASLEANKAADSVVLLSDTGSGKTLAFLLPIAQLLDKETKVSQAIIIVVFKRIGFAN